MEYLNVKYSVFGEFQVDFSSNQTIEIQKALNGLIENLDFFQNFTTGFNFDTNTNQMKETKDISFITKDNKYIVFFSPTRVDISFSNIEFSDTINMVKMISPIVFGNLNQLPNRLAINTTFVANYFQSENNVQMMKNYLVPIKYYIENPNVLEWSASYNSPRTIRIDSDENLNVITQLGKTQNTENHNTFAVMWLIDINTNQKNNIPRFNNESFQMFVEKATEIQLEIVSGLV